MKRLHPLEPERARRRARPLGSLLPGALLLAAALTAKTSHACVGDACLQIQSTAAGGGALTVAYDFTKTVQTFLSFCSADGKQCLYSNIDPGFIAQGTAVAPYFPLRDGTKVRLQIVSADAAVSMNVNGTNLARAGDSVGLGTAPTLHTHPAWQLIVPRREAGDHSLSFKLTTDSPAYTESATFTLSVTNNTPAVSTPTPTPTVTPAPCTGDCNGDNEVTVDELVRGVTIALGEAPLSSCPTFDADGDRSVGVEEIVAAVRNSLQGCGAPGAPTFGWIQDTIFTPRCAVPSCHDSRGAAGNLVLAEGAAYGQLVGVDPDAAPARNAGLLRVAAGDPGRSFLLGKLLGPAPGRGSRMPLTGDPLTADQVERVGAWILAGALP